uniref:AraC family transcriptional regulator n=1 Tax=uncultured bacterium Contig1522a TaxID=1393448 RepID=W0FGW8_9BACT|nr:AraC family transcriptional regulator [uncultured bacterium Contig1522a]
MASYRHLIRELSRLDPYEKAGHDSFQRTGALLRHGQYLYLMMHGTDRHTVETINDPPALREQGQIAASFHERYGKTGLTEEDFMPSDMNVAIEKLLRYIEIPAHSHEFIECAYVLRGSCIHRIGENEVIQQEGSFILVPVLTRHQLIAVGDSLCLTLKIRLSHFVKMSVPHLPTMIYPISFQCGEDPAAESMLLFLYEQQKLSLPYRKELMEGAAAGLMTYILQRYMDTMQPLYSIALRDQRILDMINYMYNHYRTITLHELAAQFHYNESYLSRMFQEQAGRSFSETVKDFKLRKAAELLKTKSWKLDQICEEIGYSDTRQFIRSFKQMFGVTPDRFRKLEQQTVHGERTS